MHVHMYWLHTVNYGTCNLLCTSVVVQLCNCSTTPLLCPFCPILYLCQFWRLWWASSLRKRYWFTLHRQIKSLLIVLILCFWHSMPIDFADTLIQKMHYLCINGYGLKKFLVFCIGLVPFLSYFPSENPVSVAWLTWAFCQSPATWSTTVQSQYMWLKKHSSSKEISNLYLKHAFLFLYSLVPWRGFTFLSFMPGVGVHKQYLY